MEHASRDAHYDAGRGFSFVLFSPATEGRELMSFSGLTYYACGARADYWIMRQHLLHTQRCVTCNRECAGHAIGVHLMSLYAHGSHLTQYTGDMVYLSIPRQPSRAVSPEGGHIPALR